MRVGCPKEVKIWEKRVALSPSGVRTLVAGGHEVAIEHDAGFGVGFTDAMYIASGAKILPGAKEVYGNSDLIVKVKEPVAAEYELLQPGQTLFTFLHLAADRALTDCLIEKQVASVAYETIEHEGRLPVLKPMSEVAGRMSIQVGAHCLERHQGGKGLLLSGVPGVRHGKVTIVGGGVVGANAATVAVGMGARVTILDTSLERLEFLDHLFDGRVETIYSSHGALMEWVKKSDLLIGAVLVKGGLAPKLVSREMVAQMEPGSVVVDVAVDQGGCIETCRVTDLETPTYVEEEVVHYGVSNIPGAVPKTSSLALQAATLPYLSLLAEKGVVKACQENASLRKGLNVYKGQITYEAVGQAHNLPFVSAEKMLEMV